MAQLRTHHNNILFKFVDELVTSKGIKQFRQTTHWGFVVGNVDTGLKEPRWVNVIAVGEEVSDEVRPGMKILVEPLKWTEGITYDNETFWLTNETYVMAVNDSESAMTE